MFANTMTGNVALLAVSGASSDWVQAWRHVPPLLGFLGAVLTVQSMTSAREDGRRWIREPAIFYLMLEIAFLMLAGSGVVRMSDAWLIPGISFVATLQSLSFTQIGDVAYTSVMTTGNLRRALQALFEGLRPPCADAKLREARLLGMICFSFFGGALLGAYLTNLQGDRALWAVVAILCVALIRIDRISR